MANWIAYILLRILHLIYFVHSRLFSSRLQRERRRRQQVPFPLQASRSRLPKHLALVVGYSPASSEGLKNERKQFHDSGSKSGGKHSGFRGLGGVDVEEACVESVRRTIGWCREAGIARLTVYDEDGILARHTANLQQHVTSMIAGSDAHISEDEEELEEEEEELEYPLTPPMSEHSDSRPLSPELGTNGSALGDVNLNVATLRSSVRRRKPIAQKDKARRGVKVLRRRRVTKEETTKGQTSPSGSECKELTLHILSRESSKPALASIASALVRVHAHHHHHQLDDKKRGYIASIEDVDKVLTGERGFSDPDMMIVHTLDHTDMPLELFGFPPWQIRLTEIYHNKRPNSALSNGPIDELDFRRALDEYAAAEMRFGK